MRRREFLGILGSAAAAWPLPAFAAGGRPRIAYLSLNTDSDEGKVIAAFLDGMRALGYVAGQSVDIDYRYAAGDTTRLNQLARELIALKPDVALATAPSPALALHSVAPSLPIVCPQLSDAVVPGLAASYPRPGGSVTGISQTIEGLPGKQLELALDAVPGIGRIGFLSNPTGASMKFFAQQIGAAAQARGASFLVEEASVPGDLTAAFDRFVNRQAQAVIVPQNGLFITQGALIVRLALAARLPTIFGYRRDIAAGGLASYGVDERENNRRAAVYVDKILKGAKPGDLPIEFPTKIVLAINLKTAKALGVTISPTLLTRADEVIE